MGKKSTAVDDASLANRALLIDLDCGAWWGRIADEQVSNDAASRNKADKKSVVAIKKLVPDGSVFDDVVSKLNAVRSLHRQSTLPWKDRGPRILPSAQFLDYTAKMREAIAAYDRAVVKFIKEYPTIQARAKIFLGKMYDKEEYPPAKELRERFYAKMRVFPVPDAGDFRVSLPQEELKRVQQGVVEETQESIAYAMEYLWDRVYRPVAQFADRLEGNEGETIRQGLLNKLKKVCDMASRLSLVDDKRLDDVREKIQKELVSHTAEVLREDKRLRSDIAKKARQLEKSMAGYMGRGK